EVVCSSPIRGSPVGIIALEHLTVQIRVIRSHAGIDDGNDAVLPGNALVPGFDRSRNPRSVLESFVPRRRAGVFFILEQGGACSTRRAKQITLAALLHVGQVVIREIRLRVTDTVPAL